MNSRFVIAAAGVAVMAAVAVGPASAACTRLAFSVNDYGKDGPTRDAKQLLEKYVAKWTADRGIKKYTTGKKDVSCKLFLDFIVFDEHDCTASAMVCWDGAKPAEPKEASTETPRVDRAAARAKLPDGAAPAKPAAQAAPLAAPVAASPKAAPISTGTVPTSTVRAPVPAATQQKAAPTPAVAPAAVAPVMTPAVVVPPVVPAAAPPPAPRAAPVEPVAPVAPAIPPAAAAPAAGAGN
jgi:hypothetical protein